MNFSTCQSYQTKEKNDKVSPYFSGIISSTFQRVRLDCIVYIGALIPHSSQFKMTISGAFMNVMHTNWLRIAVHFSYINKYKCCCNAAIEKLRAKKNALMTDTLPNHFCTQVIFYLN
jgi:hypothetical protein